MEPIHYLRAFRRRWWVIVLAVLIAAGGAMVVSEASPATTVRAPTTSGFTATKVLWNPGAPLLGLGSLGSSPASLAGLVTDPNVASIAAAKMHHEGSVGDLISQVRASGNQSTGFLSITGTGKDLQSAKAVADGFAQGLIAYLGKLKNAQIDQREAMVHQQIAALQRRGGGVALIATLDSALSELEVNRTTPITLTEIPEIQRKTSAPISVTPIAPASNGFKVPKSRPARGFLAALFGLLAGMALALVLERFDTRIRSARAAEEAFGLPVLAEIPTIPRSRRNKVVTDTHPSSPQADAFRLLGAATAHWTSRSDANGNGNGSTRPTARTILVTSPESRDGRTTVAANLAVACAQAGSRVLVVSADLRQPSIHKAFGVPGIPGLVDLLENVNKDLDPETPLDIAHYLQPCSVLGLAVLPGGRPFGRFGELLGSAGMRLLIEKLKRVADVVILDCASLGAAGDVVPLLTQVDGIVIVARARRTRRELAASTAALLERVGVSRAGVVLNDAREFAIPPAKRRSYRRTRKMGRTSRRSRSAPVQDSWSTDPVEHDAVVRKSDPAHVDVQGPQHRASTNKRARRDRALVEAAAIGRSQDPIMVPESESHPRSRATIPPPAMEELYKQLVDLGEQLEGSQPEPSDPSAPEKDDASGTDDA